MHFLMLSQRYVTSANMLSFLHTSGSLLMSSFAPYANRFGVLYPMQTFSIDKLLSFSDIPIFIDANNEDTLNTIKKHSNKYFKEGVSPQ